MEQRFYLALFLSLPLTHSGLPILVVKAGGSGCHWSGVVGGGGGERG